MSETVHGPEVISQPDNVRLIQDMLSDKGVMQRQAWLEERLAGQDDIAYGHVKKALDMATGQRQAGYDQHEKGDFEGYHSLDRKADQTIDRAMKIFGEDTIREVKNCENALYQFERSGGQRLNYWGEAAKGIFQAINGEDIPPMPVAKLGPEASRQEIKDFLAEQPFIEYKKLLDSTVTERSLSLESPRAESFEIPVGNIISAGSFENWVGRRNANFEDGEDDKAFTNSEGEHKIGRSLDAIIDYAGRETELPSIEGATAFIQPNGMIIYGVENSNHRVAAAKLRGQETMRVAGHLNIKVIDKNFIEPPENSQESAESLPETDWQEVFDLVEQINLPESIEERAADVANMSAEDLMILTTLLHSKLAPGVEQAPTDYSMSISSPSGENKRSLMDPDSRYGFYQETAKTLSELADKIKPGQEKEFLERASNMVALTTMLSHSFADGNGRTGRFLAHLIREGAPVDEKSREDLVLLGTNRPTEGYRIFSYIPKPGDMSPEEFIRQVASIDIPLDDTENYKQRADQLFTSPYG